LRIEGTGYKMALKLKPPAKPAIARQLCAVSLIPEWAAFQDPPGACGSADPCDVRGADIGACGTKEGSMHIQVNTDSSIQGDERIEDLASEIVSSQIGHHADRISRVEVHLADVNAKKGGSDDIRCMVEARPEGLKPLAVTENARDIEAALRGAGRKIRNLLDTEFGKLDRRGK
jgi:hypothetical protein